MKVLYLIRHAKSSWGDFTLPDFERPLNDRGKRDAPDMAKRLKAHNPEIDVFISSPAKRALKTCINFCEVYKKDEKDILLQDELYHAPAATFYKVVSHISDKHDSAAIFSHNPGITDFVNSLRANISLDNMPTCAIFGVQADIKSWKDFETADKQFLLFDYPKLKTSS
jgi:phosphohistidine phosphatase